MKAFIKRFPKLWKTCHEKGTPGLAWGSNEFRIEFLEKLSWPGLRGYQIVCAIWP